MAAFGRVLLLSGAVIFVAGALLLLADRLGLHNLPGTLTFKRGNFTVLAPVGLMIVVSVVLSVILTLLSDAEHATERSDAPPGEPHSGLAGQSGLTSHHLAEPL